MNKNQPSFPDNLFMEGTYFANSSNPGGHIFSIKLSKRLLLFMVQLLLKAERSFKTQPADRKNKPLFLKFAPYRNLTLVCSNPIAVVADEEQPIGRFGRKNSIKG
jgi:hypothetical protein